MFVNSLNFWLGLTSSLFLVSGGIWAAIKFVHRLVVKSVLSQLQDIKREVTPNGKNTARLGDTVARTEQKVDNLMAFMERYAEKVDAIGEKLEHHLGLHEGLDKQ